MCWATAPQHQGNRAFEDASRRPESPKVADAVIRVEHFNVFKHCPLCVVVSVAVLQRDQCGLEDVKEACCHDVVPTVTLPAHTSLHPVLGQEVPIALGAILAATVRMHNELRCWLR